MTSKVLFVDDENSVLEGLKRSLRKMDYEIFTASSPEKALSLLDRESIDVIVSDEKMPECSGVDFLAQVCREYPDIVRVLLTGNAQLDMAIRAINQGEIFRFLTKPCQEEDLHLTLRQAIQYRSLLSESYRLLETMKNQSDLLDDLERKEPGITKVKRDASGAIVLEDPFEDLDGFIRRMQSEVHKVGKRLG